MASNKGEYWKNIPVGKKDMTNYDTYFPKQLPDGFVWDENVEVDDELLSFFNNNYMDGDMRLVFSYDFMKWCCDGLRIGIRNGNGKLIAFATGKSCELNVKENGILVQKKYNFINNLLVETSLRGSGFAPFIMDKVYKLGREKLGCESVLMSRVGEDKLGGKICVITASHLLVTKKEILGYSPRSKLFPLPKKHEMKRLTAAETVERLKEALKHKSFFCIPTEEELSPDFIHCYGDKKSFVVMIKKDGKNIKTGETYSAGYIQYMGGDESHCVGVVAKETNVDIVYFTGDKFLAHSEGVVKINIHVINGEMKRYSPDEISILIP